MKYFVFSIDDGTIYDTKVISIFDRYNIKATFNLNSGLQDFVWYKDDKPVRRLDLSKNKNIYANHEVSSHSLTHPHLTMCPDDIVFKEVKEDIDNLEKIFNRKIETFAFPFEDFDDRCINIIKGIKDIKVIRTSRLDSSFKLPVDQYHIPITTWDINEALKLVDLFIKDDEAKLFVFVAHSYDFEFDNTYDKLEKLCDIVTRNNDVKIITTNEIAALFEN